MWKEKMIQKAAVFLLIFLTGLIMLLSVSFVARAEEEENVDGEAAEPATELTARDVLQLDEEIMQFIGIGREAIENYNLYSMMRTADGETVTITPGNAHKYGTWGTCEFHISNGQIGFCAEPNSTTPSGQFRAYKLNNDVVKALLMVAHGGPLFSQEFWDQLGQNPSCVQPDGHNDAYSLAHACIGVTYSGSITGLSPVDIEEINTLIDRAYQYAITTPQWHTYTAYVAPNNQQDIVWLEHTPPQNGSVELWKKSSNPSFTDGNSEYSLAGARYGVYPDGQGDSPAAVITTDERGYGKADNLPQGDYWLKEISAPKGFEIDTTAHHVYVSGGSTASVNVTDRPIQGQLELVKASSMPEISAANSGYSLRGAEYGIYSDSKCTKLTSTLVTDEKGSAKSEKLSIGNYWIKETKAPEGYAKDLTVYPVTVNSSVAVRLNVKDNPQTAQVSVLLEKADQESGAGKPQGSASLEGAEFTVKYYAGFYDTDPAEQGVKAERTWVLRTNDEGIVKLSDEHFVSGDEFYKVNKVPVLPLGTLTIQETKAPEGYLLNDEIFIRKITAGGDADQVAVYNKLTVLEKSLDLNVIKKIKNTETVIPDVVFKHTLPDGTTETITTDKEGKASVKGLTWGTHTIEEESVPDGFTKNPGKVTFTVSDDNTIEMTGNTSAEETGAMTFTVNADGSAGLTAEDTYAPYRLVVKKNNEEGKLLEGAEFTLYLDPDCKTEAAKAVTGKDGTLEFNGLQVETKYYLKETKAPEGYRIPVNADGSDIIIEIYTKSSPSENVFEYYINGEKHTETTGDYAVTGTKAERIVNLTVINQTGKKLPETGSYANLLLILAGIICMTGARYKRMY